MKKLLQFFQHYYLFGAALLALAVGLVLEFGFKLPLAAHWVLGVTAIIEVLPLLAGMINDLRDGTYGIDLLAATAIVASVALGQVWAGMVIVVMLTGGEALEDYAEERAKTELTALLDKAPKQAHVLRGRKTVDVAASDVQIGDKIIIKPGEVVPVDAVIIEGEGDFDEASLTGESLPQSKTLNDQLLSGSVNIDGVITARALRPAADSQYQQIIKLVKAASTGQSHFVRLADRYSIPFTIIAFAIAGTVWAISGQPIRFLEVLVVATPCPLILAAPIAVISGMSRAAKQGIIIKNGSALERFAQAKTFAFDKTGTLTSGELAVDGIKTFGSVTTLEVLEAAAALEQNSNHVLARAIVNEATEKGIKFAKAKGVQEIAGSGLAATIKGKHILVGRLNLMEEHNITMPKSFDIKTLQQTAALVAIDGILVGAITFKDEIRPESKRTLGLLKKLGVKNILMVTGDNKSVAKTIAKQLGISRFEAEALPADKLRVVEAITERPVVFVGDGVNDAPVLTASDVGVALGARGETAASESADMVIMLDDLEQVARGFAIAKRTFAIAKQSILVGIALSVILMFIFATGRFKPIYGAVIQELVDVVVIFNALRAHTPGRAHKQLLRAVPAKA